MARRIDVLTRRCRRPILEDRGSGMPSGCTVGKTVGDARWDLVQVTSKHYVILGSDGQSRVKIRVLPLPSLISSFNRLQHRSTG
jgi:hypothetical protein